MIQQQGQEGDIVDYVNEFEALRKKVTGIDEKNLIKVFFNGLKSEMKEVIRMKELVSLTDHKLAVLKMQSTVFCKVVSSASGGNAQRGFRRQNTTVRPGHQSNRQNGDNQKHETGANKENNPQQQQNNFKARLQYTTKNMSISSSLR